MLVYATTDDLTSWAAGSAVDTESAAATGALRTASLRVSEAIAGDFYDADGTGLPTNATILQAVKDATCAHALAVLSLDISTDAGGAVTAGAVTSVGIGSARKTYADATAAAAARAAAAGRLVPDALSILRIAGLGTTRTWSYG